ncbi:hypothetical protein ZIOFF_001870 [Zingiber officinale]|uniref:Uncharacterized protein n=1 Tax=Zingiber officinale TaxID=94328 RepID=A0A8J5HVG7_ZINOF|nr:hypothetical protein ZIOFF_001870 [Zingiber officinale]
MDGGKRRGEGSATMLGQRWLCAELGVEKADGADVLHSLRKFFGTLFSPLAFPNPKPLSSYDLPPDLPTETFRRGERRDFRGSLLLFPSLLIVIARFPFALPFRCPRLHPQPRHAVRRAWRRRCHIGARDHGGLLESRRRMPPGRDGRGGPADEFMWIHAAYETLFDADKRTEYDRGVLVTDQRWRSFHSS